jgi:hypothetical protein
MDKSDLAQESGQESTMIIFQHDNLPHSPCHTHVGSYEVKSLIPRC